MKRSTKHTSTSNEFLARKKNVNEEVKLREALASLDCKMSLTKDALRQDVSKVKSDLRQVRRSTGHSIEALPPTPFRLMARRYSVLQHPPNLLAQDLLSPCVSPEFHYMLDEIYGEREEDGVDTGVRDLQLPLLENNVNNDPLRGSTTKTEPVRLVTFWSPPSESENQAVKSNLHQHDMSTENLLHLPPLPSQYRPDLAVTPPNKDLLKVPSWEVKSFQTSNVVLPQLENFQRELSESSASQRPNSESSPELSQFDFNSQDTRDEEFESPVSKKLVSILSEGEWKRREYVRKNSIAGFDSFAAQLLARKTINSSACKESPGRHEVKCHVSSTGKPEDWRAYRDARTRCRTCMNRFRQNAAFQRQKLEQEVLSTTQIDLPLDRKVSLRNITSQNRSPSPGSDMEQFSTDDVLDFDNNEHTPRGNSSRKKSKLKGYNMKRLSELAEPRKGTKRKTLFSKRLITKEVDTLIQTHDQPQLTDREKERLRMLESKVRTFLATMQHIMRPASMVHIPQREDIMRVDISHH